MATNVRVRFAPSPTGPLHIGGVRTALFNYLFAKQNDGTFVLRIEDTDQTRYVEGAEKYIEESLEWLNIKPDEGIKEGGDYGPYKQSERREIYRSYVHALIEKGWAYYAFDTPEELEALRKQYEAGKKTFAYDQSVRNELNNSLNLSEEEKQQKINSKESYVIRFKIPENENVLADDIIRGALKFDSSTLDDKVIFKSDGLPTYHLANVVDDHVMKISHVIRGEEWLPSLPLHILLYEAFGWEKPQFAHLPLILKPSGNGKLSKRDGDKEGFPVFPLEWKSPEGEVSAGYRESGYFPEAVINMLALLGWNPGTEQELFSLEELIHQFSLERVNKSGARFDPDKAKWFNQQYLQQKSDTEVAEIFMEVLDDKGIPTGNIDVVKVVSVLKERASFIKDLWDMGNYFFVAPDSYDEKALKKAWKEDTKEIVEDVHEIITEVEPFSSMEVEEAVKKFIEARELGFGKVMNPLRLLIVGALKGPHLFDIMEIIGKQETLGRINKGLNIL